MQKQPEREDRKVVPRWRSLGLTPAAELMSAKPSRKPLAPLTGIEEVLSEWREHPSLEAAVEVMATTPFHSSPEADQAAQFLEQFESDLAPGIRSLLGSYRGRESVVAEHFGSGVPSDIAARYRSIAALKHQTSLYPRNSVVYVELARLYASLGQQDKACAAFRVALGLAPTNRFVVRSAVRFFVHLRDIDQAWAVVRGAPDDDPWLLSSKIAVADLGAKNSVKSGKVIERQIENGAPGQVTELAASLGTLELASGNHKRARRLFRDSAREPNDNAVAQLRWANEKAGIPFDPALLTTHLSFEARTGRALQKQDWRDAAENAQLWLTDEPFSSRAALTGSFLTAELLRDFAAAERVTKTGLVASPGNSGLHNDRAFALANLGRTREARLHIGLARSFTVSPILDVCLTATEACILYREGRHGEGARMYSAAVDAAISLQSSNLAQRAYLHWIIEDVNRGVHFDPKEVESVTSFFESSAGVDEVVRELFRTHVRPWFEVLPDAPNPSHVTGQAKRVLAVKDGSGGS